MAETNAVNNSSSANTANSIKKTVGGSVMGKDQFLKILITQLQHQDPMQPMEDKEFIAQMAQFTSLEQLMNISTQLTAMNQSLGNVSGLIGKEITWNDAKTKLPVTGTVESIVVSSGIQYAVVGAARIAITDITEIQNATPKNEADLIPATSGEGGESGGTT
ncbi:flagellar hook capping FlgD N-terminal domain-containing protein [Paenibacillus donghaensis]|uniref:Flagellar hook assembly protein FlgD n=1 Tax=Paenibacillus donghaensis TaxID=414771 RepID=A0A2Z2KVL7_9BACL|nr:flagellar hook capping FlgD N-terminal domain-containing protein [Paenibacillus donghaensis]ASA26352.1 flagellar hook assembly protein FlgD [Paenibacillus donghaensis]